MTSVLPAGLPGNATIDTDGGSVSLVFDAGMYSVDTADGASDVFIARCYAMDEKPKNDTARSNDDAALSQRAV